MTDMLKKLTLSVGAALLCLCLAAQEYSGGVKGTVISRADRAAVSNASLTLFQGASQMASVITDAKGNFEIGNLRDGMYDLVIKAPDFMETRVNVTVDGGYVKNMFSLSLTPSRLADQEVDASNFAEFDMDDSGYEDSPTILYGQNDVFNDAVSYNFSSVRFRARGYSSESQDVYLAGVRMNDALTGYTPFSLWSGLNEATRTKSAVTGSEISDFGIGGFNGLTNIPANASNVRKGWRGSVLTNSAFYRLRLMLSYASGPLDNGWSYAFNVSTRLGGNDWIKGVYYRSFAYYGSVEKKFGDSHKLGLTFMGAPGARGAQNASTQEVYDLMGDNMYNSNWGYQDGKVRNSRVRKTHEPIAILKYDYTPSTDFSATATLLYRFGKNGYTALDWYDAPDPRPDYYRNLPSYFWMENEDYNRRNLSKYAWAKDSWERGVRSITHIDWDRLYSVNELNLDQDGRARSKYVQEERRTDQKDLNLAASFKWKPYERLTLTGGLAGKVNRTENYKILADLLGGDYYVNIDQFAERDYASSPYMIQNDLDYFFEHGTAQTLKKGDKYGYDYYAHVIDANGWLSGKYTYGGLDVSLGGRLGWNKFWREGLLRKGLFPGVYSGGDPIVYGGGVITTYDSFGKAITSKGNSEKKDFLTYAAKLNAAYVFEGGHRITADLGYFGDAPTFNQAFLSPRTRNTMVDGLETIKTFSVDASYLYNNNGYSLRLTGFYTTVKDKSDVMSFYDDTQNSFTNFALSGIDERYYGVEMGVKVPTPIQNLSATGVLSWGRYEYTSNPYMTQTIDNSAAVVIDHEMVPYWKSNPKVDGGREQHYIPSTPQLAASLGLSYNYNYWFIDADVEYFGDSYLDMNPLYRTDMATAGPDGQATLQEIEYMAHQEKFDDALLVNLSVGKSWYIQRKYQLGFSLNVKNITNNKNVKTGGYEQTRLVDNTVSKERFYRFDPKYFYMCGANYMLNIYFRF